MPSNDATLTLRIVADGKAAKAEIVSLSGEVAKLTTATSGASTGAAGLSKGLGGLESSSKKAADSIGSVGKAASGAEKDLTSAKAAAELAGKAFGVAAGYFSARAIIDYGRAVVGAADQLGLLESRLKLVTNSAQQFAAVEDRLYRQAQAVGTSFAEQADLYAKLARATEGTNRPAKDLLTITEVISKNLKISGTSAGAAAGAMLQFGQAAGSGTVRAEEMNSMLEGMPTIVQGVARALGITTAELRTMTAQGKLSSEQLLDAIVKMKEATDQQMGAIATTFEQAIQRMSNSFLRFNAEVAERSGFAKNLTDAANAVANFFDQWTDNADPAKKALTDLNDATTRLAAEEAKLGQIPTNNRWYQDQLAAVESARKAMRDAEAQYKSVQAEAGKAAESLSDGFGKGAYEIEKVGRDTQATMAAIADQAKKAGVDIAAALAIASHESSFQQYNKKTGEVLGPGVGTAKGIYQIINGTAKAYGVDASDPFQNIQGGIKIIDDLQKKYKTLAVAVAAYYIGETEVNKMLRERGSLNLAFVPKNNTTSVGAFIADVEKRFNQFKEKYPSGLAFWDEDGIEKQKQGERQLFDSAIASAQAAAKAQETIAKSVQAVEVETLRVRTEAYKGYAKAQAESLTGDEKIKFIQQSADVEKSLIQQSTDLKLKAIETDKAALRDELAGIAQKLAAREQYQLKEVEVARLQDQQIQTKAQLMSLDQQANAIKIAGAGQEQQIAQAASDAQAAALAGIAKEAEDRNKLLNELDEQIAKLSGVQEAYEDIARAKAEAAAQGLSGPERDAYIDQVQGRINKINELTEANEKQKNAEKAVADEVLRTGQYYQSMVQMAQRSASAMSESFGETGKALGDMVVAIASAQNYMFQIQQQTDAALKRHIDSGGLADDAKAQEIAMQGQSEQLVAQVGMFGQVAGAARGFFEEGTAGYSAMGTAAQGFNALQMGLSIAMTAQKAIEAIATQGSAGPIIGFAAMAAMAAALAGIGAFSGSVGGFNGNTASRPKVNTGTVLGSSEPSESVQNSLEILQKNSTADLDYSAKMTRSLVNIEYALAGTTRSLLVNVNALTALAGKSISKGGLGVIPGFKDPLIGDLLFKSSTKITDYGFGTLNPQKLIDVIAKGIELKSFTDVQQKTTALFGLLTVSNRTKTYIGDVADETERQFTLVIQSLADAVREGAKEFGVNALEFEKRLADFTVSIDPTSLKGSDGKALSGKDLQEALAQQFNAIADKMAAALNITGLDEFQRAGEGMFETLTRVSSGIAQANGELNQLNINAVKYSDVQFKQAEDIGAEIIRQSIIAKEAGSSIATFMEDVTGSAADMVEVYKNLVSLRDAFTALGFDVDGLTRVMSEAVGGVSNLKDAMSEFVDGFYSDGEKLGVQLTTLARQFGELGYSLPGSKEEFRSLAESIDTSTESGQKLFAKVLALAGAFSDAADKARALEEKYRAYTNPLSEYESRIQTILDDFNAILDGFLGQIEASYTNKGLIEKSKAAEPYEEIIGRLSGTAQTRQSEIASNYADLAASQARIDELNGLINAAFASGNKNLAGYVASWRAEIDALNGNITALNDSIRAKSQELASINAEIKRLQDEMAAGAANIDVALIDQKLTDLANERARILEQQGNAIVRAVSDIWNDLIRSFEDFQSQLAGHIADIGGPDDRVAVAYARRLRAGAAGREYLASGANDPQRALELARNYQDAVLAEYEARMAQLESEARAAQAAARAQIEAQMNAQIDAVNANLQSQLDAINAAEQAALDANQAGLESELKAIQKHYSERIKALTKAHSAEQKALQKQHDAALKALQDELSNANALASAIKQVKEYAESLKLSQLSTLSPEDKLGEAKQQYEALKAAAAGGDAEALGKLSGAADAYLQAARDYYGSGTQYADIFAGVQNAMSQLGAMNAPDPDSIQAHIDAMRDAQLEAMDALREAQQEQIDAIREQQSAAEEAARKASDAVADQIRKSFDAQRDSAQKAADKQIEAIRQAAQDQIDAYTDPERNAAMKALREAAAKKLEDLQYIMEEQRKKAAEQAQSQIQSLISANVLNAAQIEQLRQIANKMGASLVDVPGYATGGLPKAGLAIIGENGPELVQVSGPTRVFNAEDTSAILNDKSELIKLRAEMRALVTTQSSANPRMVAALESIERRLSALERNVRVTTTAY